MEDHRHLLALLDKIKHDHHIDLSEYKLSTIQRRINQRLFITRTTSYRDYALLLDKEQREYQKLIGSLTVKVSWFFRDPAVFEILGCWIWPQILKQKKENGDFYIRVWSAGCADGEEAYSLAILLAEVLKGEAAEWEVSIFATDLDQAALSRCKKGVYPEDSVLEVKKGILDQYFIQRGSVSSAGNSGTGTSGTGNSSIGISGKSRVVMVKDWIKEWVTFTHYNLLSDQTIVPVESVVIDFDMIVCRNVLMYFSQSAQKRVLNKFSSALAEPGGYLVMGKHECINDDMSHQWKEIREGFKIYQKRSVKGASNM